jgi:hypothetical protein
MERALSPSKEGMFLFIAVHTVTQSTGGEQQGRVYGA